MIHDLKVFFTLISINIKVTLAYRASLLISLLLNILWVASFTIFIEVIFGNITTLGGVTKGEALLIMSFYYLFSNISDIFYRDSFEQFGEKMRTGYIDMWLTKPASSRMLMFMSSMRFDYVTAIGVTIVLFAYAFRTLSMAPNFYLLALGVGLSLLAHVIFFSILSILATLSFWLEKTDALNMVAWQLTQVSRYPRQIYTSWAKVAFTYILPLALLANLPAEVVLKLTTPTSILLFVATTLVIYIAGLLFWRKGLTKYSSAG